MCFLPASVQSTDISSNSASETIVSVSDRASLDKHPGSLLALRNLAGVMHNPRL